MEVVSVSQSRTTKRDLEIFFIITFLIIFSFIYFSPPHKNTNYSEVQMEVVSVSQSRTTKRDLEIFARIDGTLAWLISGANT